MKARPVKKLEPEGSLAENVARIVLVRIDELRSFAPRALEHDASRRQHDMRIAAKRVRYVLEATGFCFGSISDTARKRARELQNTLGELHDCDVMLPRVERRLADLRAEDAAVVRRRAGKARDLDPALVRAAPHRTAYRGLDVLSVHLQARRELLFDRFGEQWEAQERAGVWDQLEAAAHRHLDLARERRRAAERAAEARRQAEEARRQADAAAAEEREAEEAVRRAAQSLREQQG